MAIVVCALVVIGCLKKKNDKTTGSENIYLFSQHMFNSVVSYCLLHVLLVVIFNYPSIN